MKEQATERREKFTRADVYDVITMLLIGISVLFSCYRFLPVYSRVGQALWDVLTSIAYYFTELSGFEGTVTPTVTNIPDGLTMLLPFEWDTFVAQLQQYGALLIDENNLREYFQSVMDVLLEVFTNLLLFAPVIVCVCLIFSQSYSIPKDKNAPDVDEDSKALKKFKAFERRCWLPLKGFIGGYVKHLKASKAGKLLLWIWLFNLNFVTVLLEVLAYLLYFSIAFFEIPGFYAQLVKLVADVSVPLLFLPWWLQVYFGYKIFDNIRVNIGIAALQAKEAANRLFLELYLGALFIVGKQRAKKTTIITDMALTQEVIYRDKAKEKLAFRDKQFPHFPWRAVEDFYWQSQENNTLPTLASCRAFVRLLKSYHYNVLPLYQKHGKTPRFALERMRKKYGYTADNFLFGYDYERYGMTFNDGLKLVDVFEALENYLQLFFIYAAPTSLLFSNYPIRTDLRWENYGFFPELDADFFNRDVEDLEEESQYSHIGNQDYVRLGKTMDASNPARKGFEVGGWVEMEVSKERGNQITNQGVKADDAGVNAKNDMREINFKMQGHASTIDNYTFFRPFFDDQRADSLGADNKDLCDVLMVKSVTEAQMVMPGFLFAEWLYALATKIRDSFYYKARKMGLENTLPVYLVNKLYQPIFQHYWKYFNKFSVYTATLRIWNAMSEEVLAASGKYYICTFKTYRERFATDGIKEFYHEKALGAEIGLNRMPSYSDKHMSTAEMVENNSLFYSKLIKMFLRGEVGALDKTNGKAKGAK